MKAPGSQSFPLPRAFRSGWPQESVKTVSPAQEAPVAINEARKSTMTKGNLRRKDSLILPSPSILGTYEEIAKKDRYFGYLRVDFYKCPITPIYALYVLLLERPGLYLVPEDRKRRLKRISECIRTPQKQSRRNGIF